MTDRVTKVSVTFENEDGTEKLVRTYDMVPVLTFHKNDIPQGQIDGRLKLEGRYTRHTDSTDEGGTDGSLPERPHGRTRRRGAR